MIDQNICLNCKHWKGKRVLDWPLAPFHEEGRDGECTELAHVVEIEIHAGWNGGTVRWIKTAPSFGCKAFELYTETR